jgi:hypothetical protein
MAQLGDFPRARVLLRSAARAFGSRDTVARARCVVAEAEIALAARELGWPLRALDAARVTLEQHGDLANAAHARYLEIRHLLLIGRLAEAEQKLALIDPAPLPPALNAVHHLAAGGIALRRVRAHAARNAFRQADRAARQAGIPALAAEIAAAAMTLEVPAARLLERGLERPMLLADIETLLASNTLVVDACRRAACVAGTIIPLATRPVPFALVRALAETWPADASREMLIARAFRVKFVDDSYRARLRVEIGRLRVLLGDLASVQATQRGFALVMPEGRELVVLAPAVDEKHAAVLALLADGEAWSSSALALALAISQRGVQRSLDALASMGKVQSFGRGRARRWSMPPVPGFATTLLLSVPLPGD